MTLISCTKHFFKKDHFQKPCETTWLTDNPSGKFPVKLIKRPYCHDVFHTRHPLVMLGLCAPSLLSTLRQKTKQFIGGQSRGDSHGPVTAVHTCQQMHYHARWKSPALCRFDAVVETSCSAMFWYIIYKAVNSVESSLSSAFETKSGIITLRKNVFLPPSSCFSNVWKHSVIKFERLWLFSEPLTDGAETKWVLFNSGNMTPLSNHHGNSEKQTAQCVCWTISPVDPRYHYSASQWAVAGGNCC